MSRPLELLAPAGNKELGKTAILHGADAVYIGAARFGARSSAGNSIEDIQELIEFAHFFGAKVYATVNTLIFDDEMEEVKKIIFNLHSINIDGIIIQDFGLLKLDLPPINIIASTQTHNFDLERIQFIEKIGFSRVILARELSLEEISNIHKNTSIELEAFVHGSLCVSFSGRCYLSNSINRRSANRGECSQPCRPNYNVFDEFGVKIFDRKNVLSLKDLCLEGEIENLAFAGVTSFKIEGRLKDENYIKNIVSLYRYEIDNLINKYKNQFHRSSFGEVKIPFTPDPKKTFNRGFTKYFLHGRVQEMSSMDSSGSMGEYLGKVSNIGNSTFSIITNSDIVPGDGIVWVDQKGETKGAKIFSVQSSKIKLFNSIHLPTPGTAVYRNYSQNFDRQLKQSQGQRLISLTLTMSCYNDSVELMSIDENDITTKLVFNNLNLNLSRTNQEENCIKQLQKAGDYNFQIKSISFSHPCEFFIPISMLNNWRRQLLEAASLNRIEYFKPKPLIRQKVENSARRTVSKEENISNSLSKQFFEEQGVLEIIDAPELSENISTPLMTLRYCMRFEAGRCPQQNQSVKSAKSWMMKNGDRSYQLIFSCKECVMKILGFE